MYQALVIGVGSFGYALATELARKNAEVIVVENNPDRAQEVRDIVRQVIVADATDKDVLVQFAKDVDVAIVCMGEKIDSSVLVTHSLKEIGVKKIIAKSTSIDHGKILKIVGAHEVVFPEKDEATRLAASLVSPDLLDLVKVAEDFDISEIAVPEEFINKSIRELDLRNKFGLVVLAVKNLLTGAVHAVPSPEHKFGPDDVLIVIGDTTAIKDIKKR